MLMLLVARAGDSSACYLPCTVVREVAKGLLLHLVYMVRVNGRVAFQSPYQESPCGWPPTRLD